MKTALLAGLLALGLMAQAQTPVQMQALPRTPAQPQNPATMHARDGGTTFHIQSIDIAPLTGAPFSATVTAEWTRILADGTTATVKNHRTVARDSTGRVFQERRQFSPNGDVQPTPYSAIEYSDPIRHEFYSCIPQRRTCYLSNYLRPAMDKMPAGVGGLEVCECASAPRKGVTITQEALGEKNIEDLDAIGSREITTLPVGAIGNTKSQPIVKEFWYSPRLGINLVTMRFEPQSGSENFIVSNVSLNEPDTRMFEPPADYRIVHEVVERQATDPVAP